MMLRTRAVVTGLVLALPTAALVTYGVERLRANDLRVALDRVVRSQINDQVRERCESDPNWFLTGPLDGRPRKGEFDPNSDQLLPRPKPTDQPFELFAYDETFSGSSSAAPRFPQDFRRTIRTASGGVTAPFPTGAGTGAQMAIPTGWTLTPCMYFLGRIHPAPGQFRNRALMFVGLSVLSFLVAWVAMTPTVRRVRRLARDAHESARENYATIAPDSLRDELSSLTFTFNETRKELHDRKTRIDDQDEAMRRQATRVFEDVSKPLAALEGEVAAIARDTREGGVRDRATQALRSAHKIAAQLENLVAVARLKMTNSAGDRQDVNLADVVARVVDRHAALARASGVNVFVSATSPVHLQADPALIERAVSNLLENAIEHNAPGGSVTVDLKTVEGPARFTLRMTDTGPGVTEEQFRALTAVRRFRGDEGHNRRPGAPGLGLSLAREIADRSGLTLDLRRPRTGGFEVELTTRA
jgi:signal transduction histidine kinase